MHPDGTAQLRASWPYVESKSYLWTWFFLVPLAAYSLWQALYLIIVNVLQRQRLLKDPEIMTSYRLVIFLPSATFLKNKQRKNSSFLHFSSFSRLSKAPFVFASFFFTLFRTMIALLTTLCWCNRELSKKAQRANNIWWRLSGLLGDNNRLVMYITLQALFTVATMAFTVPIFLSYRLHVMFQIFKASATIWNGGHFSLEVMPKQVVLKEKKKRETQSAKILEDKPSVALENAMEAANSSVKTQEDRPSVVLENALNAVNLLRNQIPNGTCT